MPSGCQAFPSIGESKNAWQLLGVFMDYGSRKPLVIARHFSSISHLGNAWQPLGVFIDFGSKKCLAATKCFLGFPLCYYQENIGVFLIFCGCIQSVIKKHMATIRHLLFFYGNVFQ